MAERKGGKVAVLWRGDGEARLAATPRNNRFHRVFEELRVLGIEAEPAVYDEDLADAVRAQLCAADGVLVWVDPIHQGKTRAALGTLLRDVAARGPWVSAHPDVILKMGVKEVQCRENGNDSSLHRLHRVIGSRDRCSSSEPPSVSHNQSSILASCIPKPPGGTVTRTRR